MFLTRAQVAELTGAKIKRLQIAHLRANGIRFYVNAAGWPVVPVSAIDGKPAKDDTDKPWRSKLAS